MAMTILLTVNHGSLAGKTFAFADPTACVVGRGADCQLRLPSDQEHSLISRHHCLLEINPPSARVRDLGSLNGTFVNGEEIGHRDRHLRPEEAGLMEWSERELHDGDEILVGNVTLRVAVFDPETDREGAEPEPWVLGAPLENSRG